MCRLSDTFFRFAALELRPINSMNGRHRPPLARYMFVDVYMVEGRSMLSFGLLSVLKNGVLFAWRGWILFYSILFSSYTRGTSAAQGREIRKLRPRGPGLQVDQPLATSPSGGGCSGQPRLARWSTGEYRECREIATTAYTVVRTLIHLIISYCLP